MKNQDLDLTRSQKHAKMTKHKITQRPAFFSLVLSLFIAHRPSYLVMAVATLVASLLSSSTLQIYFACKNRDGLPDPKSMTHYQRLMADAPYISLDAITVMASASSLLVSVFLVLSSVSFLIEERRKEYGLMRLSGASRTRMINLELCEFSIPLALSNGLGCLLGSLLTPVAGRLFAGPAGFPDAAITFHPTIRTSVGVCTFLLMMITCLIGVGVAVRKIGLATPLSLLQQESVKERKVGKSRRIASLLLLIAVVVVGFAPLESVTLDLRSMLLAVLIIVAVYVSAPVLVRGAVSGIGLLFEKFGGGPGLLARQRSRRETAGSMAIALPAMMLLTIVISFLAVMQAGSIGGAVLDLDPLKADLVVTSDTPGQADTIDRRIEGLNERPRAVNSYETQNWTMPESARIVQVAWGDLKELSSSDPSASTPKVIEGSLKDLGPAKIAVNRGSSACNSGSSTCKLGDTATLTDKQDKKYQAEVVAIIDAPKGLPSLPMDVLSVEGGLPQAGNDYHLVTTIAVNAPGDMEPVREQLNNSDFKDVKIETRQAYIDRFVKRGLDGQQALKVMIVGGSVLALIFMMQAIAISLSERSEQNYRLYQIGVSRQSIAWSAGLESALDVVGGTVIAMGGVAIMEASLAAAFARAGIGVEYMPIPAEQFLILAVLLLIIAFMTAMSCSRWTMRNEAQSTGA